MTVTSATMEEEVTLSERVMLTFCRRPDEPEIPGGTMRTNESNALDFLMLAVPSFADIITKAKRVLDFGCGHGMQARVLAKRFPDTEFVGVDLPRETLKASWAAAPKYPNLQLTSEPLQDGEFDVVFSCSSFEHFGDPAQILQMMRRVVKPGGLVVIAFAEPWYSPHGSHMDGFCRLPWVNLVFPESTVMRVRSRFRSDGARRYEDIEGGLNRMTVQKFEGLMAGSGMKVRDLRLIAVKRLPMVTQIPFLREMMTASCSCILERV